MLLMRFQWSQGEVLIEFFGRFRLAKSFQMFNGNLSIFRRIQLFYSAFTVFRLKLCCVFDCSILGTNESVAQLKYI